MILKSSGRKSGSYGQLLNYITRDKAVLRNKEGEPFLILHNIKEGQTISEIKKIFLENENNRAHKRKGSNKLFHDILSWHKNDRADIDKKKITAIAREYFKARNENALYAGAIHLDKEHIHLHLCVSGTEAYSGRSIRVTKAEFQQIKERVQSFEQEHYPELKNSVVNHSGSEVDKKSDAEYQVELRTGQPSRREQTKQLLESTFKESLSREDFFDRLQERNLATYERGGKISGVISDEKNMRFSTLGFDEERLTELDERQNRESELRELRENTESRIEEKGPHQGMENKDDIEIELKQ